MHHRPRLGVLALLLATAVLWVGCDSAGPGTSSGPTVRFATDIGATAPADSIFNIDLTLTQPIDESVSVEVLFAAPASSALYSDIGGFDSTTTTQTVEFAPTDSAGVTQSLEVDVSDADISNGPKEAFFALQNLSGSGSAEIGAPREFTLNIGYPPLSQVREQGVGTSAIFRAIVTEISGSDVRVQDGNAGIAVTRRDDFAGAVALGDQVVITGTVSSFANQLQIDTEDLANYEVVSSGNELPTPVTLTIPEIQDNINEYENERVRVEGLTIDPGGDQNFQAGGSQGNYTVTDADGNELTLRIPGASYYGGQAIPEGTVTFEGVVGEYFSGPQLRARYDGDIIVE